MIASFTQRKDIWKCLDTADVAMTERMVVYRDHLGLKGYLRLLVEVLGHKEPRGQMGLWGSKGCPDHRGNLDLEATQESYGSGVEGWSYPSN
jgi:hypothetical protein